VSDGFWRLAERLAAESDVVVDRPRGSAHPRYPDALYPLDYGFLQGTTGGDGHGVDVWIGSLPEGALTFVIVTVDLVKRDIEVKLLLGCTEEEAKRALAWHQSASQAAILVERAQDT
jgi:inorganic pyrophosphatase